MPSPAKKGRQDCKKAHNNKEWVRISRQHSDCCTWCPANGGENLRGSHSNWGKKRAVRRARTQGKKRKQWFDFINTYYHGYAPQYYDKGVAEGLYKKV